jgi:hypothetical protein
MQKFMDEAVTDMLSGRDSWRVYSLLSAGALVVSVIFTLM